MATRCLIGKQNEDGSITSVYCHWDGYPDCVGATLKSCYAELSKINDLLALGDMSSLGDSIEDTEFYGRDRGEKGTEARVSKDIKDFMKDAKSCSAEFAYVFFGKEWVIHEVEF